MPAARCIHCHAVAEGVSAVIRHGRDCPERRCACGCGEPLSGMRPEAIYASDACRARAWKQRSGYTDPRQRKPRRNGTARRRPDLRVSYRKALDAVAGELRRAGVPPAAAAKRAARALETVLTPKQREALRDA